MKFSLTPLGNGECEICVEGVCKIVSCADAQIEVLDGRLALVFSREVAENILVASHEAGSLALDHIDRTHLA